MLLNIYCVKDEKIGFKNPFVERSDDAAKRNFADSVLREYSGYSTSPMLDMSLYKLGSFDDSLGIISTFDNPEFLYSGFMAIGAESSTDKVGV